MNKYNSDKVYKIIKKFKIPYNTLTKDSILNLIINFDKNSKTGKIDNNSSNFLLKHKTNRKKSVKGKENLYSEKINKRQNLAAKSRSGQKEALNVKEEEEYCESDIGNNIDDKAEENEEHDNRLYSVKINKKIIKQPFKKLSSRRSKFVN